MWGFLNLIPIIPGFVFVSKDWEFRKPLFFQLLFSLLSLAGMIGAAFAVEVLPFGASEGTATQQSAPPAGMAPANPGQMGAPAGQAGPPAGQPGAPAGQPN